MGRADVGAVGALASAVSKRGQVNQQAFKLLADVGADYIERKENAEYNNVVASMSIEVADWEARYNAKDFYTADELGGISEDLVPRVVRSTDDLGVETSTIRNSIPAHEVYPHLLRAKLEGMITSNAEKISNPHLRKEFLDKAAISAADKMMRASVAAENVQQEYMLKVGLDRANQAAENGQIDVAIWNIDQLEASELDKKQWTEAAHEMAETYHVTQAIRSSDQETVLTMRSLLEDENYDGYLDEANRQAAITDLSNRLTQLGAEREAEKNNEFALTFSDLSVGIVDGNVTRMDLEAAKTRGQANDQDTSGITPPQYTALVKQLQTSQGGSEKAAWESAFFDDMMAGRVYMNPDNNDHRNAVDNVLERRGLSDPEFLVKVVSKSSYMPQKLQDTITGVALNSDKPEELSAVLEIYGRLEDSAPHMLKELGTNADTVLGMASQAVRVGADPVRAIMDARTTLAEAPEKAEVRRDAYREITKDASNLNALESRMNSDEDLFDISIYWSRDVEPSYDMQGEFNVEVEKQFMITGDIDTARNLAYKKIKRTWGISGVGGRMKEGEFNTEIRSQKYPVERTLGFTTEQANVALEEWKKEEGLEGKDIQVFSDNITARDASSWQILIADPETGALTPYPKRWNPRMALGKALSAEIKEHQASAKLYRINQEKMAREIRDPAFNP